MIRDDFAVFILSHGRADNVLTVKLLERINYTGKWYIIIDDEDKQQDKYIQNFGKDRVKMFSKEVASQYVDIMDTQKERNVVIYARNYCRIIAKELGLKYFLEFDDDYNELKSRFIREDGVFSARWVGDFDAVCNEYINFMESANLYTVCFSQQGDFIGGANCNMWTDKVKRKAMNSFFVKVDNPIQFFGRLNEDLTMSVQQGKVGNCMLTTCDIMLHQLNTQQNKGGLTDAYLMQGTYVKSFYSVMYNPSCTKISTLGETVKEFSHMRYHHAVDWEKAVPKIISDKFRNY